MKLEFRGWRRRLRTHRYDVTPMIDSGFETSFESSKQLMWGNGLAAFGLVQGLSLGGDFLVTVRFTRADMQNWLRTYLREDSESALKLIANAQAAAIKDLQKLAKTASG